jgi:Uncharacterized protein conserved in archaea (DUF2143).
MFELIYERMKGFILKPVETFRAAKDDEISFTILYFFVLLAVMCILFSLVLYQVWYYLMANNQTTFEIVKILGQTILTFFAFTAWLHIWIYVLGSRQGIKNTLRVMSYSMTPAFLLGWLYPFGMIIGVVWSFILEAMGIRELHGFSLGRSIVAVILPIVVLFCILFLYVYFTGSTELPGITSSTSHAFL